MFKKLKSLGASKTRQKFRLDVTVTELEGLPEDVSQCRVVLARQAKVSVTKTVAVSKGMVHCQFKGAPLPGAPNHLLVPPTGTKQKLTHQTGHWPSCRQGRVQRGAEPNSHSYAGQQGRI